MPIEVQAQDGSTITFPDGTPQDTITGVLIQHFPHGPRTNAAGAAAEGFLDTAGLGFRDEVRGLGAASGLPEWARTALGGYSAIPGAARLAYEKLTGEDNGPAAQAYRAERDFTRDIVKQSQEEHPTAYGTGQVGGAVTSALTLPAFRAAEGAGMLARAGAAAKTGGLYGAAYGFGEGEGDAASQAISTGVGAATGGAGGLILSPAADVLGFAGRKGIEKAGDVYQWIRAEANPGYIRQEAARRILQARADDAAARGLPLSDADRVIAQQAGVDLSAADLGGNRTMSLARSAANQSPEARGALSDFAQTRFEGQQARAGAFIKQLAGGADADLDIQAIRASARAANFPAYQAAYSAGAKPIWSEELSRLSASDAVQRAMVSAVKSSKDRSVAEGFGHYDSGVTVTPDGRIRFGRRIPFEDVEPPKVEPAYDDLKSNYIRSNLFGSLPETRQAFDAVMRSRRGAGMANPEAGLADVAELLDRGRSFNGLVRARAQVGKTLRLAERNINPGYDTNDFLRLHQAMSNDMENIVRANVRPGVHPDDAVAALRQAHSAAEDIVAKSRPAVSGTAYPNLQYWDSVQRDLNDMYEKVVGREPDKARYINSIHQQLNSELDQLVPQFQKARLGAWRAFQAEDAVEAGKNFASAKLKNADFGRQLARMTSDERNLFMRGYASQLSDKILESGNRTDLLRREFLTSEAAKARHMLALGPDRTKQLEAYLRVETIADRLRRELGNSTTARQLHELGMAGGAGLGMLAGEEFGGEHGSIWGTLLALGGAYAGHGIGTTRASVATQVGRLLASNDPALRTRAVQVISRTPGLMDALRRASRQDLGMTAARAATTAAQSQVQGPAANAVGRLNQ